MLLLNLDLSLTTTWERARQIVINNLLDLQGSINQLRQLTSVTEIPVSALPTNPDIGTLRNVYDSSVSTWGATVADGGQGHVLVRWNGLNWTVVGI